MRKILLAVALLTIAGPALAQTYVNGYFKSDGTYVQPYYRSSPNGTTLDNYSTKGNVNPYTGQPGTQNPTYGGYGGGYTTPTYQNNCGTLLGCSK